jgi:hypothetical protein
MRDRSYISCRIPADVLRRRLALLGLLLLCMPAGCAQKGGRTATAGVGTCSRASLCPSITLRSTGSTLTSFFSFCSANRAA